MTEINGVGQLATGIHESRLDLNGFKAGAYFIKVRGEKGTKVFKIIIE